MYVSGPYWYTRSRLAGKTDYTACHQGNQMYKSEEQKKEEIRTKYK